MPGYREVPSRIDFPALERKILEFWKDNHSFEKLRERNKGKPRWSFLDGPITANNPMGVHHAWGRFYKDAFCRYHAMLGRELRYQNGFDCQGLWVEVEVEKELGFTSKRDIEAYGIANFVQKCKERVEKFAAIQTQQSIRLGYWMDWDNSYYTMSDENNYTIWAFLKKCHQNGWLYKGRDVMPWCGRCGTGLSQHEIATEGYRELTHVSPYIRLPLEGRAGEFLLVWTTTPWTLTSNVACAVHPDLTYIKAQQKDAIYYLVEARQDILKEKGPYTVLEKLPGTSLVGWRYAGPFDELAPATGVTHCVIPWSEVTPKEGTGIVHIAPGCGKEDFELSKLHSLAVIAPLDELGQFTSAFGPFAGKPAAVVSAQVLETLKEKGILYKRENYKHSYPVCWRCGEELLFRLVDEWFIHMGQKLDKPQDQISPEEKRANLRYQIIDLIGQARWIPGYGHDRELDWLRNMHDWMISKKRFWGLALPIFECADCGTFDVIGGKDELSRRAVAGLDQFQGHSPHRPWVDAVKIACPKCSKPVSRIKDVGNPWLDAGIVSLSTMGWATDRAYWEKWYPADLITESFPGQFRNWFYSLLAMATVMDGRCPFKTLLGYASMRATDGREMHKSWGNAIEFNEAADKAGVDAMRWLFATHIPDQNLLFGYEAIDEARRKFLTLWNVYSFFVTYARVDGFDPRTNKIPPAGRPLLDRWILSSLQALIAAAHRGYSGFQLHTFWRALERFVDSLSTWYVRRSRRRFWKSADDQDKLAAYQTLHEVLVATIEIMAPVVPFVTEEMYQNLVRSWDQTAQESVHHRPFPEPDESLVDTGLERTMDHVLAIVELARQVRQKASLKVRQPVAHCLVRLPPGVRQEDLAPFEGQIREELNTKEIKYRQDLSDLATLKVTLDSKKAGPRLGKRMQAALAAFKRIPPAEVAARLEAARTSGRLFTIDTPPDPPIEILPAEVVVERQAAPGYCLAESGELGVAVSTIITEELKQEGLVRDLIRHVQELRKDSALDVADRIELYLSAGTAQASAIKAHQEMLGRETLAIKIELASAPPTLSATEATHTRTVALDDVEMTISLVKASHVSQGHCGG